MYVEHDEIYPVSSDKVIWRYLNFSKLLSLIETEALFFCNANKLEDKFEGTLTIRNVEGLRSIFKDNPDEEANIKIIRENWARVRNQAFLNCWYLGNDESALMWKAYTNGGEGVAIKSNVGRLRSCFNSVDQDICVGQVEYIDYKRGIIPCHDPVHLLLFKRRSFAGENEIRTITFQSSKNKKPLLGQKAGININVNIDELIEAIYISPFSSEWFFDLVNSIIIRYGLDKRISMSELATKPIQ